MFFFKFPVGLDFLLLNTISFFNLSFLECLGVCHEDFPPELHFGSAWARTLSLIVLRVVVLNSFLVLNLESLIFSVLCLSLRDCLK
jgi:hypothetical protein